MRKMVTQQMPHSILALPLPLTNIPLDVVSPLSMHVILGWTKKLVEWITALFAKIESLEVEEEKTQEKTPTQFLQAAVEALSTVTEYEQFLIREFQGVVQVIEDKKKEVNKLVK